VEIDAPEVNYYLVSVVSEVLLGVLGGISKFQ